MKIGRDEVLKILSGCETIREYGVRRLGLFGSCARGESGSSSDLDFVVEFDKKSFDGYMAVKELLSSLAVEWIWSSKVPLNLDCARSSGVRRC